eukprot:Skav223927  [mRNA]  locus=scaffold2593:375928:382144:+ [translate_table: standard]
MVRFRPRQRKSTAMPLDTEVKIPCAVQVDGVTYYEVHVHPGRGGAPWRVLRRYNHFAALAKEVVTPAASLPPKFWTKMAQRNPQNMEDGEGAWEGIHQQGKDRRQGLERWLQGALAVNAPEGAVAKFLLLGRCGLQPEEALEPSAPEEECQVQLLEVSVPSGLGPDDLLTVNVPGGKAITISIPWGVTPNTPLKLWRSAAEGQLEPEPVAAEAPEELTPLSSTASPSHDSQDTLHLGRVNREVLWVLPTRSGCLFGQEGLLPPEAPDLRWYCLWDIPGVGRWRIAGVHWAVGSHAYQAFLHLHRGEFKGIAFRRFDSRETAARAFEAEAERWDLSPRLSYVKLGEHFAKPQWREALVVGVQAEWIQALVRSSKEEISKTGLSSVELESVIFCLVECEFTNLVSGCPEEAMLLEADVKELLRRGAAAVQSEEELTYATAAEQGRQESKTRRKKTKAAASSQDSSDEDGDEALFKMKKNWLDFGMEEEEEEDAHVPERRHQKRFALLDKKKDQSSKSSSSQVQEKFLQAAMKSEDPLKGLLALQLMNMDKKKKKGGHRRSKARSSSSSSDSGSSSDSESVDKLLKGHSKAVRNYQLSGKKMFARPLKYVKKYIKDLERDLGAQDRPFRVVDQNKRIPFGRQKNLQRSMHELQRSTENIRKKGGGKGGADENNEQHPSKDGKGKGRKKGAKKETNDKESAEA